ncbi:uncharacterized protein LOC110836397 isoform X5 [Zootermopsis nevadensis]|uniref:uncharacterized protein LOC110836397 isoform X5 n=1 Tax=Zootermopsis nevadensis TaxID=136037 RepID=UPI000B8E91D2|nr:uncharacterized protein LOC110836397 isoform X5 [Zootermopsis nevadensis]
MYAPLNAVDISNTSYNIFLFQCSVVFDRTCQGMGRRTFWSTCSTYRRIMQNVLKCVVTVASFLLLRMMPVSSECPECCTCRSGTFRCRNASLKSVPSNLCNDTINIDMSFNSISTLNNNIFDNMPLLKTIFFPTFRMNESPPSSGQI